MILLQFSLAMSFPCSFREIHDRAAKRVQVEDATALNSHVSYKRVLCPFHVPSLAHEYLCMCRSRKALNDRRTAIRQVRRAPRGFSHQVIVLNASRQSNRLDLIARSLFPSVIWPLEAWLEVSVLPGVVAVPTKIFRLNAVVTSRLSAFFTQVFASTCMLQSDAIPLYRPSDPTKKAVKSSTSKTSVLCVYLPMVSSARGNHPTRPKISFLYVQDGFRVFMRTILARNASFTQGIVHARHHSCKASFTFRAGQPGHDFAQRASHVFSVHSVKGMSSRC